MHAHRVHAARFPDGGRELLRNSPRSGDLYMRERAFVFPRREENLEVSFAQTSKDNNSAILAIVA